MNKILDENLPLHALKEQMEMARNYRNIGIGVMGMADMLIKMEIKYGSNESCSLLARIFKFMLEEAIIASSKLGRFPKYDSNIFNSGITEQLDLPEGIDSLYNCSLLSVAPTGSISTMLGVSGGIEPIFAKSYIRTTMINGDPQDFLIKTNIVDKYMKKYNIDRIKDLPDYFVTANDIHYNDRLQVQASIQDFVDSAISSTINLPNNTTPEDIKNIYIRGCELGLKGLTVFREGCDRGAILKNNECEVCGSAMARTEGCYTCIQCGNGRCG
jgi:ribonucleoside-diphosphate reductase alpha chain